METLPSTPPPSSPDPAESPTSRMPWEEAFRRILRREQAIATLLDLSRSFTVSTDLFQQADTLLFGTMAQLGTSRGAIWLLGDGFDHLPVLLRCHGFRRAPMLAYGSTLASGDMSRFGLSPGPMTRDEFENVHDDVGQMLTRQAGIAMLAPIPAMRGPIGLLAFGDPIDRERYDSGDLQMVEASAGIVSMALTNARLHAEVAESNRQLRVQNEAMEDLDRIKSEFVANVNHELRTPLTVIRATLEMMEEAGERTETEQRMMHMVIDASSRLQSLVENLLTFGSLSRGADSGSAEVVNVVEVLERFRQDRLAGVNAKLRELVLLRDEELPPARLDPRELLRILHELVNNAVKFTPQGTRIVLRAQLAPDADPARLRIEVSDDGPGISPARMSTLFREFEHGGASQPERAGGIGLGLPLAQRLARAMGGVLSVSSELGKGTCFRLEVPAVERRHHERDAPQEEAA